jgi:hypothetical protein
MPIISLPARAWGIACDWMGVGTENFNPSKISKIFGAIPKLKKVFSVGFDIVIKDVIKEN